MANVRLRPKSGGFAEWLSYRLDRFLSVHPALQLLAVLGSATLLALIFGAVSLLFADDPRTDLDGGLWWAITRMLDGGTVAGDAGFWRRFVGIGVTLVGMVLVAIVTGAFASSFAERLRDVRRGTFHVFERKHLVLLGYSARGDIVLRELAMSGMRATVVIVTARERDLVAESVRETLGGANHHLSVVVRCADPTTAAGVRGSATRHARAVAVLPEVSADGSAPQAQEDRAAMRSILAARRAIGARKIPVVVEVAGERGRELVELCGKGGDLTLVEDGDVSTHLLVHAVRQPGVLDVVRQVLSLDARSVYMHRPDAVVGKTFDEAYAALSPGILIGLLRQRKNLLCPPGGTRIERDDRLLLFADDNTEPSPGSTLPAVGPARASVPSVPHGPTIHVLIVGQGRSFPKMLRMLVAHCDVKITMLVPAERVGDARSAIALAGLSPEDVTIFEGEPTDAAALERAVAKPPTRLLLLADASTASAEDADADQLVTLLTLRRLLSAAQRDVHAVVEIRSAETERLVGVDHRTDFVLSREVVGMLIAQELHAICLDETAGAWLGDAFRHLLDEICTRVWLRPLAAYVPGEGRPTFGDVLALARRRGEAAIGVRRPSSRAHLLPGRDERLDPHDTDVIVIAAPEPPHVHGRSSTA